MGYAFKLSFFQISPEEGSMHSLKVSIHVLKGKEIYQLQEKEKSCSLSLLI